MVKCPTGTPSQVRANYAHFHKASSLAVEVSESFEGETIVETELVVQESEPSLDTNRADNRRLPTARDELTYIFISCFLDILLESWEGKPCYKQRVKRPAAPSVEEYGEDLGPCEISFSSSTEDYLKDLYQKRQVSLAKENRNEYSESSASEYLNEDDLESVEFPDKKKTEPDEEVYFKFGNGVWYKGRVSKRLMDGEGQYFWGDGTFFQGEFEDGCVTGRGRLEFPDLSVYEGDVYKAFRHGDGMFCFSDSPVMYSGQWWRGKKHGFGLIVYNEQSESPNFYKGHWQDGYMEGFGFRQYPSGARYVGFWSHGKRHGKGVMFWTNNDIYRGEWKEGQMHGYGEYTWKGFVNNTLAYPAVNIYRGQWREGKRNGVGVLELKNGCIIETVWVDNAKEGYGAVVCRNGTLVASELLFVRDKPAVYIVGTCDPGLICPSVDGDSGRKRPSEDRITESPSRMKVIKTTYIPINASVHSLNLGCHTQKLLNQKKETYMKMAEEAELRKQFVSLTPQKEKREESFVYLSVAQLEQITQSVAMEESSLRNFIIFNISALKNGYDYYAKLACEKPPSFKCTLLRLFLWQMFLDGKVTKPTLSLVDIDNLLASEDTLMIQDSHDPFEQIQFWQFIQILILLSWHLYGQFAYGELPVTENERLTDFLSCFNTCEFNNVMEKALRHFIENDLFWKKFLEGAEPLCRKKKFEESNIAPMQAMYQIYCNVGKPHSVRDFVQAVFRKYPEDDKVCVVRYFEKLPFCKVEGKNAMTFGGELQHVPACDPFNFPELFQLEANLSVTDPKYELTCFSRLGPKRVLNCLAEACPAIVSDGCIVNIDYKLTFLEFYKAIILCAKLLLKMKVMDGLREGLLADYRIKMEEYEKQLSEYEKMKESAVGSRNKTRQGGLDAPKKEKHNPKK